MQRSRFKGYSAFKNLLDKLKGRLNNEGCFLKILQIDNPRQLNSKIIKMAFDHLSSFACSFGLKPFLRRSLCHRSQLSNAW
jgi:hypothetical protein